MATERKKRVITSITGLESGLLRREEMHLDQRPIGERPAARGNYNYIHSNWSAFVNDYNETIKHGVMEQTFKRQVDKIYALNQKHIDQLRKASRKMKVKQFGAKSEATPIEETPVIYGIYHENELVREVQRLGSLVNWTSKDFGVLGQLNRSLQDAIKSYGKNSQQANTARTKFYTQYASEVTQCLQQLFDTLGKKEYDGKLPALRQVLSDLYASVTSADTTRSWYNADKLISYWEKGSKVSAMPNILGWEWERILTTLLNNDIKNGGFQVTNDVVKGLKSKSIVDIISNGVTVKSVIPSTAAKFQGGITVKFRRQAQFDIAAQVTPADAVASVTDNNIEAGLQLRFLYNNWVALSTFNSRYYARNPNAELKSRFGTTSRRKLNGHRARVHRNGNVIILPPSVLFTSFQPLAQYINMYMLNVAFWGNKNDANNICPFNDRFFDEMDKDGRPIPAVLLTKQHAYETADIFNYYNEQIKGGQFLWSAEDLFTGLLKPTAGKRPIALAEHYGRKVNILRNASDPNKSVYDLLLEDKDIAFFSISAFTKLMDVTKKRRLSIRLALKASYNS